MYGINLTSELSPEDYTHNLNFLNTSMLDYPEESPILQAILILNNYLGVFFIPILFITGSLGNILSIVVFCNTKLRKLSSSYYLSALAMSDTCFLFGVFIQWLNLIDIDIYNHEIVCQFLTFSTSLFSFLSVWFVVAFTVERFIAVLYPLKRQSICTVKRAKTVLFGLTLAGSVHCMPFIFLASPRYVKEINATICDVRTEYKETLVILNYIDTVLVLVVPFAIIVTLNTFIGYTVWKVSTVRHKILAQRNRNFQHSKTTTSTVTTAFDRNKGSYTLERKFNLIKSSTIITHNDETNMINVISIESKRKRSPKSSIKVTKMLLIVSTVFICLNLPSYVMRLLALQQTELSTISIAIQYFCWFLFLTNFGINFALYCVSGKNFRSAVISLFRKVK